MNKYKHNKILITDTALIQNKMSEYLIMQLQGDNLNAIRKIIIDSDISVELIKIMGVS